MNNRLETEKQGQIDDIRKLALQAKGIFIDVSMTNPASGIGQAARIAKKCKSLDISPELLGDYLLAQDDLVIEIKTLGNRNHLKADVKRRAPLETEEVERVINADFTMAEDLLNLSDDQLKLIYSSSNGRPTTNEDEQELVEKATQWLGVLGIEFNYAASDNTWEELK